MALGAPSKLLFSSFLGLWVVGGGAACVGEDCVRADVDEDVSELLQQRVKKSLQHDGRRMNERNSIWASFQGGGFRALSTYAGLTAGLLASKPGSKLGDEDGLFSRMDSISSNSGGSWFVSSLTYSEDFESLVEETASDPTNTELWYDKYYAKFLQKLGSTGASWINRIPLPAHPSMAGIAEVIFQLLFIVEDAPPSWPEFIEALWYAGGGKKSATLGSSVNSWAQGKLWAAQSAIHTLGGTGPGTCADCPKSDFCHNGEGRSVKVGRNVDGDDYLQYKAQPNGGFSESDLPSYLPAFYKFGLGSGHEASLFAPFVQPKFDSVSFQYINKANETTESTSQPVGSFSFIEGAGGKIPVVDVIGCSSAAAGGYFSVSGDFVNMADAIADYLINQYICGSDWLECEAAKVVEDLSFFDSTKEELSELLQKYFDWDWAMWSTMQDASTSFAEGDQLWKDIQKTGTAPEGDVQALADTGLFAMVDGGYVDNTAVAVAVANGATEVTAIICADPTYLFNLFAGVSSDLITPAFCPACMDRYQVFAEKNSTMWDLYDSQSTPLEIVGNGTLLESIRIWNFTATTVENQWFGTTAGRQVHINVVCISSSLPDAFYNYNGQSILVSEVAQSIALPSNSAAASTIWKWLSKS